MDWRQLDWLFLAIVMDCILDPPILNLKKLACRLEIYATQPNLFRPDKMQIMQCIGGDAKFLTKNTYKIYFQD